MTIRTAAFVAILTILCTNLISQTTGAPGEKRGKGTVVIKAARVIDGTGGAVINNGAVMVTDDKISMVGPFAAMSFPAGTKVIDLGDATLMPGFIDAHTHIVGRVLGDPEGQNAFVHDYESTGAILAVANAEKTLMAGFTTIRNVGAPNFDDMAIRKAINEGWIAGPRIMTAGHSFGITGGHCDDNAYKPGLADNDYRTGVADGADEGRKAGSSHALWMGARRFARSRRHPAMRRARLDAGSG